MKYAKLTKRNRVFRVFDSEDSEGLIEITDQQFDEFQSYRSEKKVPIWFDGRITTIEEESEIGFTFEWDEDLNAYQKLQILTEGGIPITDANAAFSAAGDVFESLPYGKQALWEPVRAKVGDAINAGDMSLAREIIETVPVLYDGMEADRNLFLALFS